MRKYIAYRRTIVLLQALTAALFVDFSPKVAGAEDSNMNKAWENRQIAVPGDTLQTRALWGDVRTLRNADRNANVKFPTTVRVFVVQGPTAKSFFWGVQEFPFDQPKLALVGHDMWAAEPEGYKGEIRIIRLRRIEAPTPPDRDSITLLAQKAFPVVDKRLHMFSSLPFSRLIPKQHQIEERSSSVCMDPVRFTALTLSSNNIVISGTHVGRPMSLKFGLDWNLIELSLFGKPVEFNRAEWTRAYTAWKEALDEETKEKKD